MPPAHSAGPSRAGYATVYDRAAACSRPRPAGPRQAVALLLLMFCAVLAMPGRGASFDPAGKVQVRLQPGTLAAALAAAAPRANATAIALALQARECAASGGDRRVGKAQRLAVIDYSRPSVEPRLWVFDLQARKLLLEEHVAHGQGTGGNLAEAFSNKEGSHQSSLGLFLTGETYIGGNGRSLRMDGLDGRFNNLARSRAIVVHGADYVNPVTARLQGRLGRSHGCPAVRREVTDQVIDHLREGQLLFAYYPDRDWLQHSPRLSCKAPVTVAGW